MDHQRDGPDVSIHQRLIFGYGTASPSDPDFSEVKLLLHMNGVNGSTTFTDSSSIGATISVAGSAQIATAQSQFGGASGTFNGTNAYIYTPTSADYAMGSSDWTVEGWKRSASLGNTDRCLFDNRNGGEGIAIYASVNAAALANGTDRLTVWSNAANIAGAGSAQFTADTWQHWAVTKEGNTLRAFIAGTLVFSATDARAYSNNTACYIGTNYLGSQLYPGYLDDVRVTIGTARYTAGFTPPTTQFPDS